MGGMTLGENPAQPGSSPVPIARQLNSKKKAEFLLALAKGGSIVGACSRIGMSKTTIYRAAQADEAFRDAIERARGEWEQAQLDAIDQAARTGKVIERRNGTKTEEPGDWHAAAWLLEHSPHTRERYAGVTRQRVELGGSDDMPPVRTEHTEKVEVEVGPETMERLSQVVMVLVRAGKLRLPEPEDVIEGEATEVDP